MPAKRVEVLEPAALGEGAGGRAFRARHVAGAHAGAWLGFLAGEAAGAARIGDLLRASRDDAAHLLEGGHGIGIEIGVEDGGGRFRQVGFEWPAFLLPAVDAAVHDEDVLRAHGAEQPPDTRRGEDAGPVMDDDRIRIRDAELADLGGEEIRRRHRVRQPAGLVADHVLVEEDGAGNVPFGIFGRAVAVLRGKIPGGVDDAELGRAELLFHPIRRDDELALFAGHDDLSLRPEDPAHRNGCGTGGSPCPSFRSWRCG